MATLPSSVADRLARLAPDQREAATAPPGPILCVAPAGSGKTTTLVARVAWLVGAGEADPASIAAITFNTRAAEELLARWRSRCAHLLVDEVQDVDASQLRMALLLAAPDNRIFLVGDDDQSIYGWRLADVRRVLGLAGALPGLRRVDLEVNYRCPAPVVAAAVRLVEQNAERFAKRVRPRPDAPGRLAMAPAPPQRDPTAEMRVALRALDDWPVDGGSRAILARTRRELLPAAALSLERGIPFRADGVTLLLEDPRLVEIATVGRRPR